MSHSYFAQHCAATLRRRYTLWSPGPLRFGLRIWLLLLSIATSGIANAGQLGDNRLHADDLVKQVLSANAGLAAMRSAVDAAESRIEPAGALPDPRLRVTTAPRTFDGFTTPAGEDRGISGVIELSQEVPWPGTLGLRADAARREAAAVGDGVEVMRLQLEARTRAYYAQWAYVHRALEINAANQDLVDELRRIAENRYAAGLARQQDVLQAEVELQRLKKQALVFARLQDAVSARLNALLNRDADRPLPPPANLPGPRNLPAYTTLRDAALRQHPELARMDKLLAANQAREGLAEKAFYPDLNLIVRNNDYRPASETRSEFGLSINLPLDRSKRRAALDAAKADSMRLRYELEDTRARLLADLREASTDTRKAAETIVLYENELIPRTRENLSAARSEYGSGGGAFLDVITAEQLKLEAELELESARADYHTALAELKRWTGGELPAVATTPKNTDSPQVQHEKP
ncbi:MAG: transporter [Salinisphaeraceae bacterium]|jgi:outer membrane protein TolC|nr:transporter [Salinisphaeraceae bacterium]